MYMFYKHSVSFGDDLCLHRVLKEAIWWCDGHWPSNYQSDLWAASLTERVTGTAIRIEKLIFVAEGRGRLEGFGRFSRHFRRPFPESRYPPAEGGSHLHVLKGVVPSEAVSLSRREYGQRQNVVLSRRSRGRVRAATLSPITG
jgi:hypothetical protein